MNNTANNTETTIEARGTMAVVFVNTQNQDGTMQYAVTGYVNATMNNGYIKDGDCIRRKTFTTKNGARKCADKFFAGLR